MGLAINIHNILISFFKLSLCLAYTNICQNVYGAACQVYNVVQKNWFTQKACYLVKWKTMQEQSCPRGGKSMYLANSGEHTTLTAIFG